jgi:hypothetical protein
MVRFALPVLLTEIDCVPLLPTVTLPKFMLAGLALSCAIGAAAPVPPNVTLAGELEALLRTETLPVARPVEDGAKVTVSEAVAPAANVAGIVMPLTL